MFKSDKEKTGRGNNIIIPDFITLHKMNALLLQINILEIRTRNLIINRIINYSALSYISCNAEKFYCVHIKRQYLKISGKNLAP